MIRYVAGTGGEPIFSLQAIFSGHSPRGNDPQSDFHTDTFHSTAKAWLFLENVAKDKGPWALPLSILREPPLAVNAGKAGDEAAVLTKVNIDVAVQNSHGSPSI